MQKNSLLPCSLEPIGEYLEEMADSGFPAAHHSDEYRKANSPCYRVVASEFIPGLNITE